MPVRASSNRRSKRNSFAPLQSLRGATSDPLRSVSWLAGHRLWRTFPGRLPSGCSLKEKSARPSLAAYSCRDSRGFSPRSRYRCVGMVIKQRPRAAQEVRLFRDVRKRGEVIERGIELVDLGENSSNQLWEVLREWNEQLSRCDCFENEDFELFQEFDAPPQEEPQCGENEEDSPIEAGGER